MGWRVAQNFPCVRRRLNPAPPTLYSRPKRRRTPHDTRHDELCPTRRKKRFPLENPVGGTRIRDMRARLRLRFDQDGAGELYLAATDYWRPAERLSDRPDISAVENSVGHTSTFDWSRTGLRGFVLLLLRSVASGGIVTEMTTQESALISSSIHAIVACRRKGESSWPTVIFDELGVDDRYFRIVEVRPDRGTVGKLGLGSIFRDAEIIFVFGAKDSARNLTLTECSAFADRIEGLPPLQVKWKTYLAKDTRNPQTRICRPGEWTWEELSQPGVLPMTPRDFLRFEATFSVPAYAAVIWFGQGGEASLMYPRAETATAGSFPVDQPLRADTTLEGPEAKLLVNSARLPGFVLAPPESPAGGAETIVLVASRQPFSLQKLSHCFPRLGRVLVPPAPGTPVSFALFNGNSPALRRARRNRQRGAESFEHIVASPWEECQEQLRQTLPGAGIQLALGSHFPSARD